MATGTEICDAAKALHDRTHDVVQNAGGANGPALEYLLDAAAPDAAAVMHRAFDSTLARIAIAEGGGHGYEAMAAGPEQRRAIELALAILVGVEVGVAAERLRLSPAARDLTDAAATAVCEPRRFMENVGDIQQRLGQSSARVRLLVRDACG